MPPSAPRYHAAVRAAVSRLDDGSRPIADVWRDVAALAESLAVPRPSYQHVYRLVRESRDLRAARRTLQRLIAAGAAERSCL
jgi:hypothetical protein